MSQSKERRTFSAADVLSGLNNDELILDSESDMSEVNSSEDEEMDVDVTAQSGRHCDDIIRLIFQNHSFDSWYITNKFINLFCVYCKILKGNIKAKPSLEKFHSQIM